MSALVLPAARSPRTSRSRGESTTWCARARSRPRLVRPVSSMGSSRARGSDRHEADKPGAQLARACEGRVGVLERPAAGAAVGLMPVAGVIVAMGVQEAAELVRGELVDAGRRFKEKCHRVR